MQTIETDLVPLDWHVERRKLSELTPLEQNPFGIITDEKRARLQNKLTRLGVFETAAIDLENNLLTFNKRYYILLQMWPADSEIDVKVPNRELTKEERNDVIFSSNIHEGQWDIDIIELAYSDMDLEALGLNLSEIFPSEELAGTPEEEVEFEPKPLPVAITQPGDIYEFHSIGKGIIHRLQCGDSTDAAAVERLLDGATINHVNTDPPYNVNYQGKTKDALKIANDKMSDSSFYQFLYDHYQILFTNMSAGATIYVYHADSEGANFRQAMKDAGIKLAQCLVWVKQTFVMGRQDYHWQHEPILYGWKEGAAHAWYSDRKQSTVLNFDKPSRNAQHPTMKPVPLVRYLVENSSKPGDNVFDGFAGSGTCLIVCEMTGRTFYGQDYWDPAGTEQNYCDSIVDRWVQHMQHNGLAFTVTLNGVDLDGAQLARYRAD